MKENVVCPLLTEVEVMDYIIQGISEVPQVLDKVISLYKKHSSKLGFFPKGAFEQHSKNNGILVATSDHGEMLLGYLLFRRVRRNHTIAIAQLCIDPSLRGKNIADCLIDKLKAICSQEGCIAIKLNCREDYSYAKKLWERNNFYPSDELEGKNKKGYKLLYWIWENSNAFDLFGYQSAIDDDKYIVVIDANIVIKYRDGDDSLVEYLMGDWLNGEVEIFYTPEFLVESSRHTDANVRAETRGVVAGLNRVSVEEDEYKSAYEYINNKLPPVKTEQDESDRKQLAYSCAFNADFFVSTDNALVDSAQCISDKYGVLIYRPEEFILHFDKHLNSEAYNPSRLKGSSVLISKIDVVDVYDLERIFLRRDKSELSSSFKGSLRGLLSNINESTCQKVMVNESLKALIGYKIVNNSLSVQLLRVLRDRDSVTLSMQLIENIIKEAVQLQLESVHIEDDYISVTQNILRQAGFVEVENEWFKPIKSGVIDSGTFQSSTDTTITEYLANAQYDKQQLEKALWPLKFSDLDLPVYVIPILKVWAMHLFDYELAEQDLFGSDPSLAFNHENVYYTASKNRLKYPARILWYVKGDDKSPGTGFIRATSYLDKSVKGAPKELYREFKRLGIYEWNNVFDLAKNDIKNEITAIMFSKTELLEKPVSFSDFQRIKRNQIQGPFSILHKDYLDIYLGNIR